MLRSLCLRILIRLPARPQFFGEMGTYDGVPGVYSMTGSAAAEAESAIGLFLFVWLGITLIVTIGAARSSITLIVLLVLLDITFALLGSFYYTGNVKLETAGGAFGIGELRSKA